MTKLFAVLVMATLVFATPSEAGLFRKKRTAPPRARYGVSAEAHQKQVEKARRAAEKNRKRNMKKVATRPSAS